MKFLTQVYIKYSTIIVFISAILTINVQNTFAQTKKTLKTIVLDAGHGGKDPGAIGTFSREKDITLSVVLKLGKMLKDSIPGLKIVYTRATDEFIDLKERGPIGNRAGGDLFLSVHVNSTAGRKETIKTGTRVIGKGKKRKTVPVYKTIYHKSTTTTGTETYVLGLTRTDEKEKAIGEYGDKVEEEEGQLDKNDPMTTIIIAQYSQAFLGKSVNFAGKVQDGYKSIGLEDRGVMQKSLQVLANSTMPGVLTELGFINNPDDEAYLNSESGQRQIVISLYTAIKSYKQDLEK